MRVDQSYNDAHEGGSTRGSEDGAKLEGGAVTRERGTVKVGVQSDSG